MWSGGPLEGETVKFPLVPAFYFDSIYAIDPARLRARGIRLLLADLDNTLVPYGDQLPTQPVRDWQAAMAAAGVTLFLLSNSRKPGRAQRFAEALGIPYEAHAGKPKSGGFRRAMDRMGVTPAETVKAMLLPGEIADLAIAVEKLSGYRRTTIEEVKNG